MNNGYLVPQGTIHFRTAGTEKTRNKLAAVPVWPVPTVAPAANNK